LKNIVSVNDLVAVTLLSQEALTVLRKILIDGVT
jgi:hypothetical protein